MAPFLHQKPDSNQKLSILSRDAQYDLACACGTKEDEHRRRSRDHRWIYPVTLPNGRSTFLFKTLLSNECAGSCRYCPLRASSNVRRCTLTPEEIVRSFLALHRAGMVSGLFLSSAVVKNVETTMELLNRSARLLRRQGFRGYLHLKIIPGASDAAITESLSLSSAVSLNIEAPAAKRFQELSSSKDYARDILRPIELISRLTAKGSRYARVKQTTQFIVGAGSETDQEIIGSAWRLYRELALGRIYFSAYQRGAGDSSLPGERSPVSNAQMLTREHRLYQVDWLIRRYGFQATEIPVQANGNLSLEVDPKEHWAKLHPEYFPVDVNRDDRERLLRVPGLGELSVSRIIAHRRQSRVRSLAEIGRVTRTLKRAEPYLVF